MALFVVFNSLFFMLFVVIATIGGMGDVSEGAQQYNPFAFPNVQGVARFDTLKFGLFIHWGPVSQWGTEISFPLVCTQFPCTVMGPGNSPVTINNVQELVAHREAYAALAHTFNPVNFDPANLAEIAYSAGFRYVTFTAEHCDGFSEWNATQNRNYSIMISPYGKDIVGMLLEGFRARGIQAGVYFCPSTWNNNNYFYPDARSAFGTCCSPNYNPLDPAMTPVWEAYVQYLHTQITELIEGYAPSHFWFDSGTYPPGVDTRIEQLIPSMRAADPSVVVQVRDGGVWHDYVESGDHSETLVDSLLGISYEAALYKFEVPGTLGEQWAYDPNAVYKTAPQVLQNLIPIIAKGGNYLLNIGLDPTGVWAPEALLTLQNLSSWFSFASEAIFNTSAQFPYQRTESDGTTYYFTQSNFEPWTYVYFWAPFSEILTLPTYKPSILTSLPSAVRRLSSDGVVDMPWAINETGLLVNASSLLNVGVTLFSYDRQYNATHADRAPCGLRDCSIYSQDNYAVAGNEGLCYQKLNNAGASVPLQLYYNGNLDNMAAPSPPNDGQNWQNIDNECFIFDSDGPGRFPVEVWHSSDLSDYWTLASPSSRATAQSMGYSLYQSLGFIDPPMNSSARTVESYAYVLRIEW